MPETDEMMYFNGIDATTGQYSLPPMDPQVFADHLTGGPDEAGLEGETQKDPDAGALNYWYNTYVRPGHYGIKEGHDPKDLAQAGWGIVFTHNASPAVVEALRPLMDWRREQATARHEHYYRAYTGGMGGIRPNDSKDSWLTRQGGSPGPVDPEIVPYYLLIVGDPAHVPYRFQTLLDVQYAVGRIHFDTPEEYAHYAESVVAAEKQSIRLPRRAAFFGVANPDDGATRLSSQHLVAPLAESLAGLADTTPWELRSVLGEEATKARLAQLLGGPETPGLLFTASHGIGFPKDHSAQRSCQGALLCQDWPGPRRWRKPVQEEHYFSAGDLGSDANLWGMIAFFFACYGAGTPLLDEFAQQAFKKRREEIAPQPFVAGLPSRMLSHPRGGALAVIGHVERAWGHSFYWGKNRSLAVFESAITSLMKGYPVGYAFEVFNERYAELSTTLTETLSNIDFGFQVDPLDLAGQWTANNDAKNYVVLGDPAVRMMVAEQAGEVLERPSITLAGLATDGEVAIETDATSPVADGEAAIEADAAGPPADAPTEAGMAFDAAGPPRPAADLAATLQDYVRKLAAFLGQAVDDAATLEVRTYSSAEINQLDLQGGRPSGADLRAFTSMRVLGDIEQVIPLRDGEVDTELWNLHFEMVKQAQANRTELVRAAVSAAASLARLRDRR